MPKPPPDIAQALSPMTDTNVPETDVQPLPGGPVLILTGPTACGKSGLAVAVAETFEGVIINADSMQVYSDLHILSARPDIAAEARIPHRLYGISPAREACSAARWGAMARQEIAAALEAGKLPILVGGTGLYIRALLSGLVQVPPIPEAVRNEVRARQETDSPESFHAALARRDPIMAARLHPSDSQRIARALEVIGATGTSLASYQDAPSAQPLANPAQVIAALPPRAPLLRKIETRLDRMVESGALDEVRALLDQNLDPALPAMKAVGVPQLAAYLQGTVSRSQAIADAKTATRRYAKRQRTWLRHQTPRDAWRASFLFAQFSKSSKPLIFNEIREFLLTAQP